MLHLLTKFQVWILIFSGSKKLSKSGHLPRSDPSGVIFDRLQSNEKMASSRSNNSQRRTNPYWIISSNIRPQITKADLLKNIKVGKYSAQKAACGFITGKCRSFFQSVTIETRSPALAWLAIKVWNLISRIVYRLETVRVVEALRCRHGRHYGVSTRLHFPQKYQSKSFRNRHVNNSKKVRKKNKCECVGIELLKTGGMWKRFEPVSSAAARCH